MRLSDLHEKLKKENGARQDPGMGARVLTIDIESSPSVAHVWGLWKQNVGINQIVDDGRMLCFAAKWYDEDQTMFYSEHRHGREKLVQAAWDLLDEADVVISYNGRNYDMKHLNREFVLAGLPRPRPYREIDLLAVVRKHFKFPSNKLDFVADRLGVGRKVQHEGHDLWRACMDGDTEAWARMEAYNRGDVELTEALADRVRPWLTTVNLGLWAGDSDTPTCPSCGSVNVERDGSVATNASLFDAYRCVDCGGVCRSGRASRRAGSRLAL